MMNDGVQHFPRHAWHRFTKYNTKTFNTFLSIRALLEKCVFVLKDRRTDINQYFSDDN